MQCEGGFEEALPFMLRSVALREDSHTLCLSLSELALLYLDMLQLDEADAASHRMLLEASKSTTIQYMDRGSERDISSRFLTPTGTL